MGKYSHFETHMVHKCPHVPQTHNDKCSTAPNQYISSHIVIYEWDLRKFESKEALKLLKIFKVSDHEEDKWIRTQDTKGLSIAKWVYQTLLSNKIPELENC